MGVYNINALFQLIANIFFAILLPVYHISFYWIINSIWKVGGGGIRLMQGGGVMYKYKTKPLPSKNKNIIIYYLL